MLSDGELLRRYVADGADAAFTELVQRHINVVYAAALRRVGGNAHAADDVTQRVFSDLARKARTLQARPSVAGWLYTGTRFAAAEVVRGEQRRRTHEQEAHTMHELNSSPPLPAGRLEPFLDEIMDLLDDRDRDAVLLHFFEGRSFAETGAALSLSADAARMRVNRALDRLRAGLAQRGVTSTAAALATVLGAQSALAAPAQLAATVAGQAVSHAAAVPAVSLAARLLQAAKSSTLLPWAGAVLLIGVAGFSVHAFYSAAPAIASPSSVTAASPAADQENVAVSATIAPMVSPSATDGAVSGRPARRPDFAALSSPERNLLLKLWNAEQMDAGGVPGRRVGLRIGPLAPGFGARDLLIARGWARLAPKGEVVFITKAGEVYCKAHLAELDALRAQSSAEQPK